VKGPDFERPPVEEVALSVQFAPLRGLTTAHVARYWESVRDRFPSWKEARPIDAAVEVFGAPLVGMPKFEFRVEGGPIPNRALFEAASGSELVQVQRDRFVRNWRRREGSNEYPRFPTLRNAFRDDLDGFRAFISGAALPSIEADQCEITYVNHLPAGEGWAKHGDVGAVIGPLSGPPSDANLPEPETVEATFRYRFPWPDKQEPAGRLHVQVTPVHRISDGVPMLKVVLTARGRPRGPETADVLAWFDVGHDFLVTAFASLTTPTMHHLWGRRDVP
jgi:uncharacterized protein (TIGR04255 family)